MGVPSAPADARGGKSRLSVIIPTLDEAPRLTLLLEALAAQRGVTLEVLVADGGSYDHGEAVARQAGALWLDAPRGRGRQMNNAARMALGEELLFLHADSRLTSPTQLADALAALDRARLQLGHRRVAGHFGLQFDPESGADRFAYRFHAAKSLCNRPGCFNGDQGLLVGADYFRQLGGFDDSLPFLEDRAWGLAVERNGVWITLPGLLGTSARRFEREGYARRTVVNALVAAMHRLHGVHFFTSAQGLYRRQAAAGQLRPALFFRLAQREMRCRGRHDCLRRWLQAGRLLVGELWQPFLWLDTLLWGHRNWRPGLSLHDGLRRLLGWQPLLGLGVGLAALLGWLWFQATWAWYAWRDGQLSA